MLVFADPAAALRCAVEVQRALAERAAEQPRGGGSGCGWACTPARRSPRRATSSAATSSSRRGSRRRPRGGEILVSEALREHGRREDGLPFDEGRELELKGLAGTHRVFRAEWQAQASAPA